MATTRKRKATELQVRVNPDREAITTMRRNISPCHGCVQKWVHSLQVLRLYPLVRRLSAVRDKRYKTFSRAWVDGSSSHDVLSLGPGQKQE